VEQVTERLAEVPFNKHGDPAWQKIVSHEGQTSQGMPRRVGVVRPLTEGDAMVAAKAIDFFIRVARPRFYYSEVRFEDDPVKGRVKRPIRLQRLAGSGDVMGLTMHFSNLLGGDLGPQANITITLNDGLNYEVGMDGVPRQTCVFCRECYGPVETDPRGIYHQKCRKAAESAYQGEQAASKLVDDVIFDRAARDGGRGARL